MDDMQKSTELSYVKTSCSWAFWHQERKVGRRPSGTGSKCWYKDTSESITSDVSY